MKAPGINLNKLIPGGFFMGKTKVQAEWKRPLLFGIIGCGVYMLFLLVLAMLYEKGTIGQGREAYFTKACFYMIAMLTSALSCRKIKSGKMLSAGICAGVFIFLLITICVFQENSTILNMSFFWNVIFVIFSAFLGCVLTLSAGKRKRRKR